MSKVDARNPARLDSDDTVWIGSSSNNRETYHTHQQCHNYQFLENPRDKDWEIVKLMNLTWCERCMELEGWSE